ncbi:ATP-binding cassette domain-containing protein [Helicobacter pylori]
MRKLHRTYKGPAERALFAVSERQDCGQLVLEAKRISKSYGECVIVKDFSLRLQRGDKIGIVGPNGIGKTTLLSVLIGRESADSGVIKHGVNVVMALLDQQRILNGEETLAHYLTGGRGDSVLINGQQRHVVSYLKDCLFLPEQAYTPIKELSGGERARLMLARLLLQPANCLILDEPTNDLDMETLDLLQELISDFAGTVIVVSHDRDFLDRTVSHILAPEGNGRWTLYAGGYSDMMAQRKRVELAQHQELQKPIACDSRKKTASSSKIKPRRLSYKQVYALENLPEHITLLQNEIRNLEKELSDPALYSCDQARFECLSAALEEKKSLCTQKEEEWLDLELLREAIEKDNYLN